MTAPFDPHRRNYRSLSVKDLLDARESRHVQLMAMDNVIGTAIGLYRIHKDSPHHRNDNTAAAAANTRALFDAEDVSEQLGQKLVVAMRAGDRPPVDVSKGIQGKTRPGRATVLRPS